MNPGNQERLPFLSLVSEFSWIHGFLRDLLRKLSKTSPDILGSQECRKGLIHIHSWFLLRFLTMGGLGESLTAGYPLKTARNQI